MPFTPEQLSAINQSVNIGSCYIDATAGAGKSTTLAEIAKQIVNQSPNNKIWLITFTNKSARDIIGKVGSNNNSIVGGTFHSVSLRLMKESGLRPNICDEYKKSMIIKTIFNCRKDKEKYEEIYNAISKTKCEYPLKDCQYTERYNQELDRLGLVDFDDLINHGIETINTCNLNLLPTHILVDELQDTSQNQHQWLKAAFQRTNCRMIGVGDIDQVLYAWRGARVENIDDFIKDFNCEVKPLGLNFRSDQNIVNRARKLIENNKKRMKKDIRANSSEPGLIHAFQCNDIYREIDVVVSNCKKYNDTDVVILYRNRTYKMQLEYELRKNKINYTVNDSTELVDRSSFRTMIAMCKIGSGYYDVHDLEEAMKAMKAFGKTALDKVKALDITKSKINEVIKTAADKDKRLAKSVKTIFDIQKQFANMAGLPLPDYIKKLRDYIIPSFDIPEQMMELLILVTSTYKVMSNDIYSLCNELGLNGNTEENNEQANVILSTIHGWKGSESDVVLFPWTQQLDCETDDLEDERRLFFVAATRAKHTLLITYSGPKPRFVKEIMS